MPARNHVVVIPQDGNAPRTCCSAAVSKCFGIHCRFYVESFKVVAGCQLRENVSSVRSPSWSACARQADVLGIESRLSIPSSLIHLRKPTKFSKPSTIAIGPNWPANSGTCCCKSCFIRKWPRSRDRFPSMTSLIGSQQSSWTGILTYSAM